MSRSISLGVLASMASAWAACLIIQGLWFFIETPQFLLLPRSAVSLIGVVCIAAGNLVFMGSVADKVFPSVAHGRSSWAIELFVLSVLLTSVILLGAWLL